MAEKAKPVKITLAFGSSVRRFGTLGLHPRLITDNASNPLGPGQYNPKHYDCKYKKKSANWKQRLESEEFSKYLGFRNPKILADRRFAETLGGPGTFELFDYKPKTGASTLKNLGFGSGKRFPNFYKDEKLPPGAHNIKSLKTRFTTLPTFEFDGFTPRFKSTEPRYKLPSNRYFIALPSIVDKVVSKRGPYDTFTGPRDETTIRNHFAPAQFKSPDTFYPMPSAMDQLLHNPNKKRCGKFFLGERFPPNKTIKVTKNGFALYEKDQGYPGPAEYDISLGIKQEPETLYPFNSSNKNARPLANWKVHPGPDRYFVKYPECPKKGQKKSWMFLSKATRGFPKVESYSNFFY